MIPGCLGEASNDVRAEAVTLPAGYLPKKQREAYLAVTDWMRRNPECRIGEAFAATGVSRPSYYLAKNKMEDRNIGFAETDMIRPGDKIVERQVELDKEREREAEAYDRMADVEMLPELNNARWRPPLLQAEDEAVAAECDVLEETEDAVVHEVDEILLEVSTRLRPLERDDAARILKACAVMLAVEF